METGLGICFPMQQLLTERGKLEPAAGPLPTQFLQIEQISAAVLVPQDIVKVCSAKKLLYCQHNLHCIEGNGLISGEYSCVTL